MDVELNSEQREFAMEKIEAILDEQLEKDQQDRESHMTVEEAMNLQVADGEALEAVGKVAHVAQSSLRRLQQVVKEKDDLIGVLQDAVGSAYKNALDQHENDQHDLELLQKLLLVQEDRSIQAITDALKNVIKQQPSSRNSLAGQVARLFDQYLHEISITHEQETEGLQRNLAMLHNRCQELEDSMDHERMNAKAYLNARLGEKVTPKELKLAAICTDAKSQLEKSEELVEDLKRQLNEKDEQLRVYQSTVHELESLLEEEKARENNLSAEHERICAEARRSLGQVSNVGLQLQKLKEESHKFQQQEHRYEHQLRDLRDKVTGQKTLIHKLAVQLAALRKKTKILETPPLEKKATESPHETQKQTQYLQDCIQKLSKQILLLENELREAKMGSFDPVIGYTQDITPSDETNVMSPFNLADKSFALLHKEGHEKLTRKTELLQRNIKAIKQELQKKDNDMSVSRATIEQLRYELRKSKETIQQLQEEKRKKMESWKKNPTDCVRLKGLLENIETLEIESTILKHEVTVQKNIQIANLERELKRAQGFDLLADGKQHECSRATKILDENMAKKVKNELEGIIANKESMILELKFEADQAIWKLAQVEKRFNILFGALECKKFDLNAPVADTLLDKIFSSDTSELSAPALILLREKVLHQRGSLRSGSRERELQDLVNALIKVVEKLNSENETLKQSCEDSVKHMEKNRKFRMSMKQLQNQTLIIREKSKDFQETGSSRIILDLKAKLQDLTEANAGLIKALRDSEDISARLKQRVHEQQSKERREASQILNKTGRRCSSSEEGTLVTDQQWRLKSQTKTIENLEKQLKLKDQDVAQLNNQLEKKDDELDLLHGKLWVQETIEGPIENMYQKQIDMWSAEESNTRYCDVKLCSTEDYIDTQFIEENEWESLKEENQRLKAAATTEFEPQFFEDVINLKDQFESLAKTCQRYEELLQIYSRQIGVPFVPLRKIRKSMINS